jgi:hypothetical protein
MKLKEKLEARRLRKEEGWSIGRIRKHLGVAKSSVSLWVRDIELTECQKQALIDNHEIACHQLVAHQKTRLTALNKRKQYQEKGKQKAKEHNFLHIIGSMLFWCEGNKDRNSIIFTNGDTKMCQIFVVFLKECLDISSEKIKININAYTNNGMTIEQIENHWLSVLNLNKDSLRKSRICVLDDNGGNKVGKLPYGICRISIGNTEAVQHIYGAIQEYCNFENINWIL